jgi:hypothetical protein
LDDSCVLFAVKDPTLLYPENSSPPSASGGGGSTNGL